MPLKIYKPTSPGRRHMTGQDFSALTRGTPQKSLLAPLRKKGGRNNKGRITCRHRGGGHKRRYRRIDFRRDKRDLPARVESIEYDPNCNAFIALLLYRDGERRYILAPKNLQVGDELLAAEKTEPRVGNAMPLRSIPLGFLVHNVELEPGRGGKVARGAGTYAQLLSREGKHAFLELPSGERRKVNVECWATIGQLGNLEYKDINWGKAGRKRWLGFRPTVRGTAQNPVAHPMGGGEGRSGGGRHPCSPWGKPAKGGKTRKKRKPSNRFIVRGRKKGRFQKT